MPRCNEATTTRPHNTRARARLITVILRRACDDRPPGSGSGSGVGVPNSIAFASPFNGAAPAREARW
uniref:Uncharacterized protein n=1 Tax=Oryza nivara TaxID=4536 RepID=A0A0E0I2U9_ORYNI